MTDDHIPDVSKKVENLKSWRHVRMLTDYGLYPVIHEPLGGFPVVITKEEYEKAFNELVPDRAIIDIRIS